MSKSYKKTPYCTDHRARTTKKMKRCANKTVRQFTEVIPRGTSYKKLFCSYDICDYKFYCPLNEHKRKIEADVKAFVNGALPYDPRDEKHIPRNSYDFWRKSYFRK